MLVKCRPGRLRCQARQAGFFMAIDERFDLRYAGAVGNNRTEKTKARRLRKRIARKLGALGYCLPCGKLLWATQEHADEGVESLKVKPGVKRADLIHSYPCPNGGLGFHIGHGFRAEYVVSLCTEERQ
jgi:hypothetical protein